MDQVGSGGDQSLQSLGEGGSVPECRMQSAQAVQDFVRRLIQADEKRSYKRSRVAGLVDGNPPYSAAKLRAAGRADAANLNVGTGRSYLESGSGAFYDLFSEAPGFVQVRTSHGNAQQRIDWSREMNLEADVLFATESEFDNAMQISQHEMTLYGTGPLIFEDEYSVLPRCIESADLLVPNRYHSDTERWDIGAVLLDYSPTDLYDFIRKESAAERVGWQVAFTQQAITAAMAVTDGQGNKRSWEWCQNDLKSNSYSYVADDNKVIRCAHVYWKEFDGRTTHAIVQRDSTINEGTQFLFLKVGRFENFKNCIHPMYFDRGRGGYHHNVTGLGVKMYGLMESENRLWCNLFDKVFAPKTLLTPGSNEGGQKLQMARLGDYAVLPAGTTVQQNPIQGFITDGMAMMRTSAEMMRSNLSSYRQPVDADKPGNPETAFKERMNASEQGSLSGTTFSRYYKQLDALYAEILRRLCNLNSTDKRAIEFQKRCADRGVPRECFGRIESVTAVRVIGQGSPFMRQQVVQSLAPFIMRCSEDGQNNWLDDLISSHAGQNAVQRYNPHPTSKELASDQRERAMNQVAGMKIGLPPTITASQDALTFAATFLQVASQAIESIQKGGSMEEIVNFMALAGPAIHAHILRLQRDPLRKPVAEAIQKQFERIAKITDELKKRLETQAQNQKAQQAKTKAAMSDEQIKDFKAKTDAKRKLEKQNAQLAMAAQKHRQQLAIADSTAASDIHRNNFRAFNE